MIECIMTGKKVPQMRKYSFALFAIIFIIAFSTSPAASSLSVSGAIFEAEAAPGEQVSHNLTIGLSLDEPAALNLTADVLDWYQDLNSGNNAVKENPDISPYSAKNFLSVSPKNFRLSPNSSQVIKIVGKMPIGDGGRYAIISVLTLPGGGRTDQGVGISIGMPALVLLTIKGSDLIRRGEIENLSLEDPASARQQNISLIFKDTGNCHYVINTSAALKDGKGNTLAIASPATKELIIPTARKQIKLSLTPQSELKPGTYTIGVNVTLKDGTILDSKEMKFEIKP
jgi:hypothetical protein